MTTIFHDIKNYEFAMALQRILSSSGIYSWIGHALYQDNSTAAESETMFWFVSNNQFEYLVQFYPVHEPHLYSDCIENSVIFRTVQ